ncbi:DUF4012 domain-containing protein [Microbacterium elymi]|uniref:DUF4012 domain-containing protein n=1 Tax=Microbacterium elymi TaxID=2909587 RepID=A0ABY5NKS1_9MICO|nr:DUF4012 domain-containing protein [Microbacterium elymi]UUT35714.1 DUF4012 domain-containing protein [Microbacterium elymi]
MDGRLGHPVRRSERRRRPAGHAGDVRPRRRRAAPGLTVLGNLQADNQTAEEGGVDLAPLREAQASLPAINKAFAAAYEKVDGIDRGSILPAVDNAIGSLVDVIEEATPALRNAEKYLPTILDIAGGDGPRTYMIVFQNNAEVRSAAGCPPPRRSSTSTTERRR